MTHSPPALAECADETDNIGVGQSLSSPGTGQGECALSDSWGFRDAGVVRQFTDIERESRP